MANSKANIYPIQLQGAELNLNKYDAEIKQYSGFNKNNAPFVGGCLANVFTKDETQEGSTSENTYIDTNGDVYHVDTEGLWKNGEKVIDCEGKNFYSVEKVNVPSNTVFVYDEYCYVYYKETESSIDYYIRFYIENTDTWQDIFMYSNSKTELQNVYFDCKVSKFASNNKIYTDYAFGYGRMSPQDNIRLCYKKVFVYTIYEDTEQEIIKTGLYEGNETETNILGTSTRIGEKFIELMFTRDTEQYCYMCVNSAFFCKYLYSFAFDISGESVQISRSLIGSNYNPVTNSSLFDSDFDTSRIPIVSGENYIFYFYSNGRLTFKPYEATVSNSKVIYCDIELKKNGNKYFKLTNPLYYSGILDSFTAYNTSNKIFSFGTFVQVAQNVEANKSIGVCDFQTIGVYYNNTEEKWELNTGAVLNKVILLNNEVVTGLTLPDTSLILATDWNSVDENYIFISKPEFYYYKNDEPVIYYKSTDGFFYKIIKSIPKVRKVGNQIIINCDTIPNSFRTTDEKKILFAPSWNNRCLEKNTSKQSTTPKYFASSINEYAQEDNSSIILNPVPVYANIDYSFFPGHDNYKLDLIKFNVYIGNDSNDVVYNYTQSLDFGKVYKADNLIGLPFPADTNGNVEYSPSLFAEIESIYGNKMFVKSGSTFYPLMKGNNNEPVMSFYLASGLDNLEEGFIVQGQFYGIINNGLYSIQYSNGVLADVAFVVDVTGLKFCGNTPYQAFFFSKTNRCLYSFTGANVMNQAQFLDKFEDVIGYKYNPATQTIFMITENEVIAYSSFGTYEIYFPNCKEIYLLENGACLTDDEGNYRYIKYYAENGYTKQNITLDTCFYGMNNQTVTINDCLYVRLFSEEHESGNVEISASTLSNSGRMTEKTTFRIKSTDWDKMTHTVYLRYQPKEQRGLGVSFSINSPFKIAALSVGSQPDAILIDKVSKNAINAPQRTTNNNEW